MLQMKVIVNRTKYAFVRQQILKDTAMYAPSVCAAQDHRVFMRVSVSRLMDLNNG